MIFVEKYHKEIIFFLHPVGHYIIKRLFICQWKYYASSSSPSKISRAIPNPSLKFKLRLFVNRQVLIILSSSCLLDLKSKNHILLLISCSVLLIIPFQIFKSFVIYIGKIRFKGTRKSFVWFSKINKAFATFLRKVEKITHNLFKV